MPRKNPTLLLCLTLLSLSRLPLPASAAEVVVTPEEAMAEATRTDSPAWYGAYLMNRKIGWQRDRWTRNEDRLCSESEFELQGKVLTGTFSMRQKQVVCYGDQSPYRLETLSLEMEENGTRTTVQGQRLGENLKITVDVDGSQSTRIYTDVPDCLADAVPWAARNRMSPGDTVLSHRFDEMDGRSYEVTTQLVAKEERRTPDGAATLYRFSSLDEKGLNLDALVAPDGRALQIDAGPQLKLVAEPEATARAMNGELLDIFTAASVPALGDFPFQSADRVTSMTVLLKAPAGYQFVPTSTQTLVARDEAGMTIKTYACKPQEETRPERPGPEMSACTASFPCDVPWIRELAKAHAGASNDPLAQARALSSWVHRAFHYDLGSGDTMVQRILQERKGDCSEYAKAFVTLARAMGIPSRTVSGLVPAGDRPLVFAFHAWAEVWVEGKGWISLDPTWGHFPVDASHLALDLDGGLKSTSFIGTLELKILEVETDSGVGEIHCP